MKVNTGRKFTATMIPALAATCALALVGPGTVWADTGDSGSNEASIQEQTEILAAGQFAKVQIQALPRVGGANRFETASLISKTVSEATGGNVIVTSGTNFPDGLVSGSVAGKIGAPILLTAQDSIPSETVAELKRLQPGKVIVAGGSGAVSDDVLDEISELVPDANVERIAGVDRYETAAKISQAFFPDQVSHVSLTTGADFPDAIVGSAGAAHGNTPLLLSSPSGLPELTKAELLRLKPQWILVIGSALSQNVLDEIKAILPQSQTAVFGGKNRYETALNVARFFWGNNFSEALIASGSNFPDALTGATLSEATGAPILLSRTNCNTRAIVDVFNAIPGRTLLGGPGAMPDAALSVVCPTYTIPPQYLQPVDHITPVQGTNVLTPGWNGVKVGIVQQKLGLGWRFQTMNSTTIRAVRNFQARAGLPVTGIVDEATWNALGTGYTWNVDTYQEQPRLGLEATREQRVETMIGYAYEQLGTRYVWGGAGPREQGFDCSGLVLQSLYAAGIDPQPINVLHHAEPLYRTSQQLYWHNGLMSVPFSQRQRGDLVFMGSGNTPYHVALYLGNNQILETWSVGARASVTNMWRWGRKLLPIVKRPFP